MVMPHYFDDEVKPLIKTTGVPASAEPLTRSARLASTSVICRGVVPSASMLSSDSTSPRLLSMRASDLLLALPLQKCRMSAKYLYFKPVRILFCRPHVAVKTVWGSASS